MGLPNAIEARRGCFYVSGKEAVHLPSQYQAPTEPKANTATAKLMLSNAFSRFAR